MASNRIPQLITRLQKTDIDAVVLNPGPSMYYFTGLQFHLMERPTIFILDRKGRAGIILPELEASKVKAVLPDLTCFTFGDNPNTWLSTIQAACKSFKMFSPAIGIEPNRLRYLEFNYLHQAFESPRFISAEQVFSILRIQKDPEEICLMRRAVEIAEKAFLNTLPMIRPGISERVIAAELTVQMLRDGSDPEFPFAPIVASGPESANPHAIPSDRLVQHGDMVVIDWGASYQGYISDLTRTVAIGAPDPELLQIYETVKRSNQTGRKSAKPGIPAGDVDRAGRQVIHDAGYGEYFTHRIGHGIGLEAHEDPYMFAENDLLLTSGMTFTIEPGIYLPGKGGVRIEDDMVITSTGAESISTLDRDLIILPTN
jgi:Xaa-Pro dipeptidase